MRAASVSGTDLAHCRLRCRSLVTGGRFYCGASGPDVVDFAAIAACRCSPYDSEGGTRKQFSTHSVVCSRQNSQWEAHALEKRLNIELHFRNCRVLRRYVEGLQVSPVGLARRELVV